jgi:uncharacterized membrane protein
MIGRIKSKVATWFMGRAVRKLLRFTTVDESTQKQTTRTIKEALGNIMRNKPTMKNEPVVYGGVITIAVALAGAFQLELSAEQLATTISTIVAIATFVMRMFVTPTNKEK